jgi:hypothetical protein
MRLGYSVFIGSIMLAVIVILLTLIREVMARYCILTVIARYWRMP